MKKHSHGFTLIELMITVAIIGFLAAIAYPSYTGQVAKGRRTECKTAAYQTMQQQERYFTQYNQYITTTYAVSAGGMKSFSGDTLANSACNIGSFACNPAGNCVEVRAQPRATDPAGIEYLYVDSDARRGCSVGGTRTQTNDKCW